MEQANCYKVQACTSIFPTFVLCKKKKKKGIKEREREREEEKKEEEGRKEPGKNYTSLLSMTRIAESSLTCLIG